jgi:hypothetical protein
MSANLTAFLTMISELLFIQFHVKDILVLVTACSPIVFYLVMIVDIRNVLQKLIAQGLGTRN